MPPVPGLLPGGECAAGINGANRLGGNSLSDLLVFGKRRGEFAAGFASENKTAPIDEAQVATATRRALEPFERSGSENPYQVQQDLQEMMQDLVGIVRTEAEMKRALDGIAGLRSRAARARVAGNREYNPGWHTALDLPNLLTVSEAVTRSALERKESRGAHFREDYPHKVDHFGQVNIVVHKGPDGTMQVEEVPIPEMPEELK